MNGYISEIRLWGGNTAPKSWEFCNGQILQISSNQELYNLIGDTYGGDGHSTFALPDMQGRSAVGAGEGDYLSAYYLGMKLGATEIGLNASEMPVHTHGPYFNFSATATPNCSTSAGASDEPEANYIAKSSKGNKLYNVNNEETMAPSPIGAVFNVTCASTGDGTAHSNMQASLVSSYIICVEGDTPVKKT